MRRHHVRFTMPLVALALVAAGCGSSSSKSSKSTSTSTPAASPPATASSGGGETVKLSAAADGSLAFDTKSLKAKAGNVTVAMANPSSTPHAVAVEGNGVDKDGKVVSAGGTSEVTLKLKPGTYEFYCPVQGHRAAGMEGKLVVN